MVDDIDRMLQGEDTPNASQAEQGQQDDSIQRIEQHPEEEVEWNTLSGSAQERFRTAFARAKAAEDELLRERSLSRQQPVPQAPDPVTGDQRQALETLSKFGVATDEKVDQKVNEATNRILRDLKDRELSSRYSGSNGEPQYVPEEVEDFVSRHPQYKAYDREDVFKFKMFPDEFLSMQKKQQPSNPRSPQLRPTKQVQRQDALTPEYIEARLKQPDGDDWYEANKAEINKVVTNYTLQFKDNNTGGQ